MASSGGRHGAAAATSLLAAPSRTRTVAPEVLAAAVVGRPAHATNPLNPFATSTEVKAASRAFERGASSAQIRAEVEALKRRTAELQELKNAQKVPSRRVLKAQRDEIGAALTQVESAMGGLGMTAPGSIKSSSTSKLQLPSVDRLVDPGVVPDHIVAQFRSEYKQQMLKAAERKAERKAAKQAQQQQAQQQQEPELPRPESELEAFRRSRARDVSFALSLGDSTASRAPKRDVSFAQFVGAEATPEEAMSPGGRRRTEPSESRVERAPQLRAGARGPKPASMPAHSANGRAHWSYSMQAMLTDGQCLWRQVHFFLLCVNHQEL